MQVREFSVDVIEDMNCLPQLANDWDDCVRRAQGDVYFLTDWLSVWLAHRARGRRILFFRAQRAGETTGVLPFVIDEFGFGLLRLRVARLAGLKSLYPAIALPLLPDFRRQTIAAILDCLAQNRDIHALCLSPISSQDSALPDLQAAIGDDSPGHTRHWQLVRQDGSRRHVIQKLPSRFEEYFASLSQRRRKGYRRELARLGEKMKLESRVVPATEVDQAFDRFVELHTTQWRARGKGGHFSDWPGTLSMYRELVRRLAPTGHAVIHEFRADGRVLASQLGFRIDDRFYWRLTARSSDSDIAQHGPGTLGCIATIEWLIGDGVRIFEDGAGDYGYKESLGGEGVPFYRLLLARRRPGVELAVRGLDVWAKTLDLLYYKIWFLRVVPRLNRRLGLEPRPLWGAWIKAQL